MSETSNDPISIQVTDSPIQTKDQSLRKNDILSQMHLARLGETDHRYRECIFVQEAFDAMIAHGMSDRTREVGGILSGFHQGDQTIITRFIPAISEGTAGQFHFTESVWATAIKENDRMNMQTHTDDNFVGWFHTHPKDYPPEPRTMEDRYIMQHLFGISDKHNPKDMTTFIMTTYSNNPRPRIAAWKWDKQNQEAVWMKGIAVATRSASIPNNATYFIPESQNAKRWGEPKEKINLTLEDINPPTVTITADDLAQQDAKGTFFSKIAKLFRDRTIEDQIKIIK